MTIQAISNFVVLDSIHGKFIINRHSTYQAEALIKTGRPHIQPELDMMMKIIDQLPSRSVAVDAGANAGLVCVPLARRLSATDGQVHAFEPQLRLFNALCGTVALNDLDNLTVHNLGIGEIATRMSVPTVDYSIPQDFGTVSLEPIQHDQDAGNDVSVVNLDSFGLERLDFLKIDVEGMEIDVLRGAKGLITEHQPWCWVEYWKVGEQTIMTEFAGLDYAFFKVDSLNLLCVPVIRWDKEKLHISIAPLTSTP